MRVALPLNGVLATLPATIVVGMFLAGHLAFKPSTVPVFPEPVKQEVEAEAASEVIHERAYFAVPEAVTVKRPALGGHLKLEVVLAMDIGKVGVAEMNNAFAEHALEMKTLLSDTATVAIERLPYNATMLDLRQAVAGALVEALNARFATEEYPAPIAEILFRSLIQS